jgi:hypothetical protein
VGDNFALVEQLLGHGKEGGATQLFADHPDPTVRLVAELLSRRAKEEEEEPAAPASIVIDTIDTEPSPRETALRRKVRVLSEELERLGNINETLATALGACELCWGEESGCQLCHGRGTPGSRCPDRELFRHLVVPAVRRLKEAIKNGTSRTGSLSGRSQNLSRADTATEERSEA